MSKLPKKRKRQDKNEPKNGTKELPSQLVNLVQQGKITDLHIVDKKHLANCIALFRQDVYFSSATSTMQTTVMEGGTTVKIGKLTYPNFNRVEQESLELQISRVI